MNFTEASQLSMICFVGVVVFVLLSLVSSIYFANLKIGQPAAAARRAGIFTVGLGLWLFLFSQLVQSGWIEASPMPRLMIVFMTMNVVTLLCALSKPGSWLAAGVPLAALVAFQGFRFPLELILHQWVEMGTIPESMTWTGSNFDIISGVVALIAAFFAGRNRTIAWIANIVGFALLLNVMRVAVLSSPLPFAWQVSPPLMLAFHLPYALIVPVCVGGALFGHVVLTRALLSSKNR